MNPAAETTRDDDDDQIEIDHLVLDVPEGVDADVADGLARDLVGRLHRLIEEV